MGKPLLSRVQASNETWFSHLSTGARFRAVLFPVNPNQLPTSVFVLPRLGMRVRLQEPVKSGDLVLDPFHRVHLVADHDLTLSAQEPVSRAHACFQMTNRVFWRREVPVIDPVTLQPASTTPEELGPIWASIESFTHTNNDPGNRIQTDRLRCITAAPLQVNDFVFERTVRRVQYSLGVYISEIE